MATSEGSWSNLLVPILQSTASQWMLIFSLIFGGCCSNAWALESTARHNPHSGTLITFAQYLIVVATNLPKHFRFEPMMRDRVTRKQVLAYVVRQVRGKDGVVLVDGGDEEERDGWWRNIGERVGDGVEVKQGGKDDEKVLLKVVLTASATPTPTSSIPTLYLSPTPQHPNRPKILSTHNLPPAPHPTLYTTLPKLHLRTRKIPIKIWLIQVLLFFLVSLLNNLALGFDVNLAVHIIFRSGGLAASLLMGWLVKGKRYTSAQIVAVGLITLGVASATLSTKVGKGDGGYHTSSSSGSGGHAYAIGIALLTIALLLSAGMGLAQEDAYAKYGRHWEEGLFYLHFLGLPMFAFVGRDLASQFRIANASPPVEISAVSLLRATQPTVEQFFYIPASPVTPQPYPHWVMKYLERAIVLADALLPSFTIPSFWVPLGVNVVTQLICVSGVHRLTARVSSLTVTLILVLRKAVSLGISVLLIQGSKGNVWLWGGAASVLLGTVLYSVDGAKAKRRRATVEGGVESKKRE